LSLATDPTGMLTTTRARQTAQGSPIARAPPAWLAASFLLASLLSSCVVIGTTDEALATPQGTTTAAVPYNTQGYAAGLGEKETWKRIWSGFDWCAGPPLTACVG
jgi:hypothetical protein